MNTTVLQVGVVLFVMGLSAVILRGQLLAMLLGLELMIASVSVLLAYHASLFNDPAGLAAVVLIIVVSAAEAVIGLCLIIGLHRAGRAPETQDLTELREP